MKIVLFNLLSLIHSNRSFKLTYRQSTRVTMDYQALLTLNGLNGAIADQLATGTVIKSVSRISESLVNLC